MLRNYLLLTFLTNHVLCEQSSLAFIIDNSGSSVNDIFQVKSYAKDILDMILNELPIDDILVVTFNEPEITRTMTQDKRLFRKALDLIELRSGNNCPEMALSGIVKGLKESQTGSYLYVFSHTSAKDYDRFEEVKSLCKAKKSKVFFILTGECQGSNPEMNDVYNNIAVACGGEVLRINSNELDKTFQFLRESAKVAKNVIKSVHVPPMQWTELKVNKRESNDYMFVSASGTDVDLRVVDQKNNNIGNYVAWMSNLKALKLEHFPNNEVIVKVRSTSNGHIAIYGHTPVQRVQDTTNTRHRYYGYLYDSYRR